MNINEKFGEFARKAKEFYLKLENRYYAFLDRLEPKYHVYKFIDPVDKIVPSFALLLGAGAVVALLLLLFIASLLGGFSAGTPVTLQITDKSSGNPIPGAEALVTYGTETYMGISDSDGCLMANVTSPEITVEVTREGYETYTRNFLIEEGYVIEIKMEKAGAAPAADASLKTINVVDSDSGMPIMDSVRLNFSCSGQGTVPDMTVTSGSVPIRMPENCGVLQVSARAPGYQAETAIVKATTTYVRLSKDAPAAGRLAVRVLDASSRQLSSITLQVYSTANIPQGNAQTDSSGSAVFELSPGTYYVTAYDPSGKYADGKSSPVSARADQTETAVITMQLRTGPVKMLKIKFTDLETGEAIAGVDAAIYKDGIEFTRAPSESDGTVTIPNATEGATYTVTARHDQYLLKTTGAIPLVSENENPVAIQLERPNELNSATASVHVKKAVGEPIEQAQVYLYAGDVNRVSGSYIAQGRTNAAGNIEFINLPPNSYYAYAEYETYKGTTGPQDLAAGSLAEFEISMVVSKGTLLITAEDEEGAKVQFAKVAVYDSFTDEKVAEGVTDTKGKFQAELFWNIEPHFEIEAEGYFTYKSSNYSLIPNEKTEVDVTMFLADSYPDLSMNFEGVYSSTMKSVVDTFSKARTYMYKFKVIAPENYGQAEAVFVANPQDADLENSSFVLKSPFLSGAEYDFSTLATYDPLDPYLALDEEVADGTSARRMVVSLGDLTPGVYDFFVAARLEDTDQTYIPFRMDYGMRAYLDGDEYLLPPIALYTRTHHIGVPQSCEGVAGSNFPLELEFEDALTGEKAEVGSSALELRQNLSGYELSITLANCSSAKTDYSGYRIDFVSDSESAEIEGDLFKDADSVSRSSPLNYGDSISESFDVEGVREDSDVKLVVNVKSSEGALLASRELHFKVVPMGEMVISANPSEVFDVIADTIEVTLKGESGESIRGAGVYLYAEDPQFSVQTPRPLSSATRPDKDGFYLLSWNPQNSGLMAGDFLYLVAESPSYAAASAQLEILSYAALAPMDLACVTVDTEGITLSSPGVPQTITITTRACPLPLDIKVVKDDGFGTGALLVRESGTETGGTQKELTLRDVPRTGKASVDVIASDSIIQGAYGLTVDAELVGSGKPQRIATIDVLVSGTGPFSLVGNDGTLKSVFSLQMEEGVMGSDTATVKHTSPSNAPNANELTGCARSASFQNSSNLVDLQLDPTTGICGDAPTGPLTVSFTPVDGGTAVAAPPAADRLFLQEEGGICSVSEEITFSLSSSSPKKYGYTAYNYVHYDFEYFPYNYYFADAGPLGDRQSSVAEKFVDMEEYGYSNISDASGIIFKVPCDGKITIPADQTYDDDFLVIVAKEYRKVFTGDEIAGGDILYVSRPFRAGEDFIFADNDWVNIYVSDTSTKFGGSWRNGLYSQARADCEACCENANAGESEDAIEKRLNCKRRCEFVSESGWSSGDRVTAWGRHKDGTSSCLYPLLIGDGSVDNITYAGDGKTWEEAGVDWELSTNVYADEVLYMLAANVGGGTGTLALTYSPGIEAQPECAPETVSDDCRAGFECVEGSCVESETTVTLPEIADKQLCTSAGEPKTVDVSIQLPSDFTPASGVVTIADLASYYTVSCALPGGGVCEGLTMALAPAGGASQAASTDAAGGIAYSGCTNYGAMPTLTCTTQGTAGVVQAQCDPDTYICNVIGNCDAQGANCTLVQDSPDMECIATGDPLAGGTITCPAAEASAPADGGTSSSPGLANFTLTLSVSECPTGIGPSEIWSKDSFKLKVTNKTLQGYTYDVLNVKDYVKAGEDLAMKEGKFRVRLDAGESLLDKGYLPKVHLGWNWDDFDLAGANYAMCDFKYGNYVYCDSTQLMMELVQKMIELRKRAANDSLAGQDISELTGFHSYLLYDDYSSGFLQQFLKYSESQLAAPPTDYTSFFKQYLVGKFSMVREKGNCSDKRSPGVYEITIDVENDDYTFEGGKTTVKATCLSEITAELKKNPFYYMPFNGNVGLGRGGTRSGFGLGYTGTASSDIYVIRASGAGEGDPDWVKLQDASGGVMPLSYSMVDMPAQKGRLMKLVKGTSGIELEYSPIVATRLVLGLKQENKAARIFYNIKDTSLNNVDMGESALALLPLSSSIGELENFDGFKMEPTPDQKLSACSSAPSGCSGDLAYGICESGLPATNEDEYVTYNAILYTPEQYSIANACGNDTTSSLSTGGSIEPTGWEIPVRVSASTIGSIQAVLKQVEQGKAGILIDGENASWSILWRESELLKGLS